MQAATVNPTATEPPPAYWPSFRRMPLVLQAFAAFTLCASVFSLLLIVWPALNQRTVAYLGWSGLTIYLFLVYFAFAIPIQFRGRRLFAVVPILSIGVFQGILELVRLDPGNYSAGIAATNPFLRFDPLRPVFTIVMPLFWILLLLSPAIWRWIRASGDDRHRGRQMTLRDYFYLLFVTAACTALSLGLVRYATAQLHAANAAAAAPSVQAQP